MNTNGRRGSLFFLALAAVVVGVGLIGLALHAQRSAAVPEAAGRIEPHGTAQAKAQQEPPSTSPGKTPRVKKPLPASAPVSLSIPAIGVQTPVLRIGLAPDGTLAVPQPGPDLDKAAWFENSPTPGQPGPSIIEGHVDSEQGPSVFFRLGDIKPGDAIHVVRADGSRLTFVVNAVRDFSKAEFPTQLVYGGADITTPQLRIITCSDFSTSAGTHLGNEVVFAHLTAADTGERRAPISPGAHS